MTQGTLIFLIVSTAFLGVGTFLLLPHRYGKVRPQVWNYAGAALSAVGVLLMAALWVAPTNIIAGLFFYGFGIIAMGAAILMITSRNPVHSALWFAIVVLSTTGLFLLAGAQFLAVGTIIVYAGAIIVTFLFVIMLAQAEGQALYDRLARSPVRSSLVSFLLLLGVLHAILTVKAAPRHLVENNHHARVRLASQNQITPMTDLALITDVEVRAVLDRCQSTTSRLLPESSAASTNGFPPPHVAGLGAALFTDHLISVEIAGAILFTALVGAICIATPRMPVRPQTPPPPSA